MKTFTMIMLTSLLLLAAALFGSTDAQDILAPGRGIVSGAITELSGKIPGSLTLILLGSGLISCSLITRIKSKKQGRTH